MSTHHYMQVDIYIFINLSSFTCCIFLPILQSIPVVYGTLSLYISLFVIHLCHRPFLDQTVSCKPLLYCILGICCFRTSDRKSVLYRCSFGRLFNITLTGSHSASFIGAKWKDGLSGKIIPFQESCDCHRESPPVVRVTKNDRVILIDTV